METIDVLKKIGLDDDEVAVYMAALQMGPSLVTRIAKFSGVKRTTVYLVAKSLMAKGLLGQYSTQHGLHLSAQSPDFLLKQMEEKTKEVASILPQLKALSKKDSNLPQVKYFEGKEGYFTICEDTLQKHSGEILWLGDPAELYKVIGEKYDNDYYVPERIKRKIKLRALLVKNAWSEKLVKGIEPKFLRQIEFLPDNFMFNSSQVIYQNKVAFVSSSRELICVLIESKDLAEMERAKFEMLWQKSKKQYISE